MNSWVTFIMTEIEYLIIHLAFRANAGRICNKEIFYLYRFLLNEGILLIFSGLGFNSSYMRVCHSCKEKGIQFWHFQFIRYVFNPSHREQNRTVGKQFFFLKNWVYFRSREIGDEFTNYSAWSLGTSFLCRNGYQVNNAKWPKRLEVDHTKYCSESL